MSRPPTKSGGSASAEPAPGRRKVTVNTLQAMRNMGQPISVLTAYDYPSARLVDEAGVDAILVGDSLAMVVLGHENTLAVTMAEMLHHARAVSRGARWALLIGDMPFMSYQVSTPEAVKNAGRFLQEAGMDAVKLEGGRVVADTVRAITRVGIPVQGHIGLTPQSVNALGGWHVQGRTARAARGLLDDALALEDAGCFSIVIESVPDRVAGYITERLHIPTIGIGAGAATSGQVLVYHDVLGLFDRFTPKFVRRYAELGEDTVAALRHYHADVDAGQFPAPSHTYGIAEEEWQEFLALVEGAAHRGPTGGDIAAPAERSALVEGAAPAERPGPVRGAAHPDGAAPSGTAGG